MRVGPLGVGLGFRVEGLAFRIILFGLWFKVQGVGLRGSGDRTEPTLLCGGSGQLIQSYTHSL